MRELLADGRNPSEAAAEVGKAYNFKPEAVLQFSSGMIKNIDALRASAADSMGRSRRKSELNGYVGRLEIALRQDPKLDISAYLETIPWTDITAEEREDVFYRCNMAWLGANV
ncbi:MAG: hypothetical protein V4595_10995 [Pseudomonadota bacterium]|jgi:hypothetical protein